MYIQALFIDNSLIFIYKEHTFTPSPDLMRKTGGQALSIWLKKNEKCGTGYPVNGSLTTWGKFSVGI